MSSRVRLLERGVSTSVAARALGLRRARARALDRGIDGIERTRLARDDIDARVHALLAELAPATPRRPGQHAAHDTTRR